MLRNLLFTKTLMIVLLSLLLLIPLSMIQSKITERQALQQGVQQEIARSASGPQTLSGPYLVLRYKLLQRHTVKDATGLEKTVTNSITKERLIAAHELIIDANADVESRKRGIYQVRLFNFTGTVKGSFDVAEGYGADSALADMTPVAAYFVLTVSDARGIRNAPQLTLNKRQFNFAPGVVRPLSGNGIHAALEPLSLDSAHKLSFEFPLELQGMSTFAVTPSGDKTELKLNSSWPHPSFGGSYLPRSSQINADGFRAQWLVTNLARNSGSQGENGDKIITDCFSINFIDPVNIYLLSERAVKYGLLFIVLLFAGFFMFEMVRHLRIHPMQYLLVGMAQAMFFLLIISLSEHIPFLSAYAISATACTALIGIYLAGVLHSYKPAIAFSSAIALLYAVLYGVLQSEDNALLMGTTVLFSALAATMLVSRKLDWYSFTGSEEEAQANLEEQVLEGKSK